jgi:hypothetical protein
VDGWTNINNMKAQILKIAGVKNEKEFYRKFPTEEAFMAKHGAKLTKAQDGFMGAPFQGMPSSKFNVSPNSGFNTNVSQNPYMSGSLIGGQQMQKSYISSPNTSNFGSKMKTLGSNIGEGVKKAIAIPDLSTPSGLAGMIGGIGAGINTIKQTDKNIGELEKYGKVSDVVLQATKNKGEPIRNIYDRPEKYLVQNMNPKGTGTNYLAAENGAEIANYYTSPNTIYTDGGFEPLNDSNVKQYKKGGKLKKADPGAIISAANSLADVSRASGQLGGGLGSQWGGAGGETGGYTQMLGGFGLAGGLIGGLLDAPQLKRKQQAQSYLDENTGLISGTNQLDNFTQQNSGFMENGGWVSNDWMPQTITKFGDYNMKELLAPPHDADMLRAGGHLKEYTPPSARAMYTGRDLPYQMEDGGQMAMGGELQTLWGGGLETISRNPYDNSEIIMPKGQSHDESDGRGRTGIGIKYGDGGMSDYAEYGASDQDASVEVERNEPMVKMADGGNADNLVVFGNMIEDESKKKYKVLAKEIAKDNNKQIKIMQKAALNANNNDDDTVFGQFAKNTDRANTIGPDMKLKENSMTLKHYAAKQNAILDTAKEFGLESDALAKGKIKYAKPNDPYAEFGAKLSKAKGGESVDSNDKWINKILNYETTKGSGGGKGLSNFGYNDWEKFGHLKSPQSMEEARNYFKQDYLPKVNYLPEGLRERAADWVFNTGKDPRIPLLLAAGKIKSNAFGLAADRLKLASDPVLLEERWNEHSDEILKKSKDPKFLKKFDTARKVMYQNINKGPNGEINPAYTNTWKGRSNMFADDYTGLINDVTPMAQPAPAAIIPTTRQTAIAQAPIRQAQQMGNLDSEDIVIENKNVKRQPPMVAAPTPQSRYSSSSSQFPSPIDEQGDYYMPISEQTVEPIVPQTTASGFIDPRNAGWNGTDDYQYKDNTKDDGMSWDAIGQTALSAIYPFIRPTAARSLDPNQLAPEMLASAMNQQEPVRAQLYNPMLTQATSISLQDQLNEVTAQTRDAMRMAQGDPSALSMIASQAQQAKSKILGEQFRMNQAEKQRVNDQNINTLNDAQMKNLGILDQQYVRQATGTSKTKEQSIAIAKSIADKIAQNKLENKQVTVMENMYPAFNFTQDGVAYKNPMYMASLNPYGSGSGTGYGNGQMPAGMIPDYDTDETTGKAKIVGWKLPKETKSTKRNGAIVKAIKGL